jgi:hypothetical protein
LVLERAGGGQIFAGFCDTTGRAADSGDTAGLRRVLPIDQYRCWIVKKSVSKIRQALTWRDLE